MDLVYLVDDGIPLVAFVEVYLVVFILSCNRLVRRNCDYVKLVDFAELNGFRCCRTGHSGKLRIHPEEVLERDCRKRPVPLCNLQVLLCFYGLMESVTVATSFKYASREFIDYLDLSVLYDIVYVCMVEYVCTDCLGEVVHVFEVLLVENRGVGGNQVVLMQYVVDFVHAPVGERNPLALFIDLVFAWKRLSLLRGHVYFFRIVVGLRILCDLGEHVHVLVDLVVLERVVLSLTGNDQRSPCLIDEDGVYFVNDTEVEAPLDLALDVDLHVVAEVVESELVVRSVGDVAVVCGLPCFVVHVAQDASDRLSEEFVDAAHPL